MKTRKAPKPQGIKAIPRTWDALTKMLPLRPIRDEVDCDNATEVIDRMAGHALNADQEDYLDALATLVAAYEDAHHPVGIKRVTGLRSLKSLLADHEMNASDLARLLGVHRSHGSKILSGERSLTTDHMRTLAARFKVNPSLFM